MLAQAEAERNKITNESSNESIMISSCELRNFRCFKQTKIDGLKRFTLVVGDSGSGKTALLEGLFLAGGGNAEIYLRLRVWRGFGQLLAVGTKASYEAVFRDMFYNFDSKNGAYLQIADSDIGFRKLRIFYEKDTILDLALGPQSVTSADSFSISPITFKWETPRKISNSQVEISSDGRLKMRGTQDVYFITFVSSHTMSAALDAVRYSELSIRNATEPVVQMLQEVFPDVVGLSLETISGDIMLYVQVKGMPEKLPIVSLSGGLNKYLSIVLAILSHPGAVVIIDETVRVNKNETVGVRV